MNIPNSSLLPRGRKRKGCFGNIVDPQKTSEPWVPNEAGTPEGNGGCRRKWSCPGEGQMTRNSRGFEGEAWLASEVKTRGNGLATDPVD